MTLARRSWFGCSVLAGAALAGWALTAQIATSSLHASLPPAQPSPLQTEFSALEVSLFQWIDDKDAIARSRSLVSATEMARLLEEDTATQGPQAQSARSMLASLEAGLQALSIQDRLIQMAEREVRRHHSAESVARLVRANERREEIITIMIEPAIALFDGALGGPRLQRARTGWFPPLLGEGGI